MATAAEVDLRVAQTHSTLFWSRALLLRALPAATTVCSSVGATAGATAGADMFDHLAIASVRMYTFEGLHSVAGVQSQYSGRTQHVLCVALRTAVLCD